MKDSGITWNEASFEEFIKNPKAKVPGTKMTFPGLQSDDDIKNVIAYLKTFGTAPAAAAAPAAAPAAPAAPAPSPSPTN